jgi:hypothetical protein
LICWALRVAVPSVTRLAVRFARPPFPSGSRREPASSTILISTSGRLRCSDTSNTAPFGNVSCVACGPRAPAEAGEDRAERGADERRPPHRIPPADGGAAPPTGPSIGGLGMSTAVVQLVGLR